MDYDNTDGGSGSGSGESGSGNVDYDIMEMNGESGSGSGESGLNGDDDDAAEDIKANVDMDNVMNGFFDLFLSLFNLTLS